MSKVLLSASYPAGARGEQYSPYDVSQVTDACVYVVRALLRAGHRVSSGAHPTISPLLLSIAGEMQLDRRLEIFQSAWFEDVIPRVTQQLHELGHGTLTLTDRAATREESLTVMRTAMCLTADAAVFVGGKEGIVEEGELAAARGIPCFAVVAPGGATRHLANGPFAAHIVSLPGTRYPQIAATIVASLGEN